jgi:hypothetical protein
MLFDRRSISRRPFTDTREALAWIGDSDVVALE